MRRKLRVAVVTGCFVEGDGVGRTVAQKIDALRQEGHEASLWVQRGAPPVPKRYADIAREADFDALLEDCLADRRGGFLDHDLFLVEFLLYYPVMEAIRFLPRGRVVVEYPGLTPVEHYRHEDHYYELTQRTMAHHRLLDFADAVWVHSESMGQELKAIHPGAADRIEVLRPGTALDRFAPAAASEGRRGDDGRPVALYVGRLAGNKRVDLLVELVSVMAERGRPIRLLVVGDGRTPPYDIYRRELEGQVARLGLRDSVVFAGKVSEDALPDCYRGADVFVTASLHEGFCLPVVEANASGLPVLASDCTALRETVGEGGLLFSPGDVKACADGLERILDERSGDDDPWPERCRANARRLGLPAFREGFRAALDRVFEREERETRGSRQAWLETLAELPLRYHDRCDWPIVGPLVSRLRRRLTLQLEKFYLRRLQRQQAEFNRRLLEELSELRGRLAEVEKGKE